MAYITQHWLSIGAGVFLLAMILYGHNRGVVKLAVSVLAFILTIIIVRFSMPYVTEAVKNNEAIHNTVQKAMVTMTGMDKTMEKNLPGSDGLVLQGTGVDAAGILPQEQLEAIQNMKLPQQLKDALSEHNTKDVYKMLGVSAFSEYAGSYLTGMIINMVCFVLLFAVVFVLVRVAFHFLDFIVGLPVLNGINKIAGGALGGIEALLILWLLLLVVPMFLQPPVEAAITSQISQSTWLSFLDRNNIVSWVFTDLIKNLF